MSGDSMIANKIVQIKSLCNNKDNRLSTWGFSYKLDSVFLRIYSGKVFML